MQTLRGKGKIYDSSENYVDEVTYDISLNPPTESARGKWWGEITPKQSLMLVGNYIIELDDGRRGPCVIEMKTTSSFGLVVDSFNLKGAGPLTQ